jgi:hypothetical protein
VSKSAAPARRDTDRQRDIDDARYVDGVLRMA